MLTDLSMRLYKLFYCLDSRSHTMFSFSYADILLINWWKFKLLLKSIRWLTFFFFFSFLMCLCLTFDMPLMHWVVFLSNHPICSCVLLFEGFCNWGTTINCWVDNIWWSTWWSIFWVGAFSTLFWFIYSLKYHIEVWQFCIYMFLGFLF